MTITLKTYQTQTLDALREYLTAARLVGAKQAFEQADKLGVRDNIAYQPLTGLPAVPYVCLRLPTGGGKTLLSAHTVKIAADAYLEREFPLVLWLVPTNTIRNQTLETLKKPGNPNYEALSAAFDGRFGVWDIADFATITPADLKTRACIIVGTMQTFRVNSTEGRKVYARNEDLETHFTDITKTDGMDIHEDGENKGKIKYSFRNLLTLHRPLVLVDEAHNNTSSLSYEVLQRVNAACVVEFTATPADDSNVLHNVSATELKAAEMIKLPIRLAPHQTWEQAVIASITERQRLHDIAKKDSAYIRPIVLLQAEDKGREITKEVMLQFLLDQNISRSKIAIVTGDQKELDGINLFAPDCPIDFVITVEALKEGWDCSFAYVFCSVATVQSKKDVEQILGRVLRMPYAKRRADENLNRAYAHVSATSWPNAVKQLHDRLVDMGFEDSEALAAVEDAPKMQLEGGEAARYAAAPPPKVFELAEDLSSFLLPEEEKAAVVIEKTATGSTVKLTGGVSADTLKRMIAFVQDAETRKVFEVEVKQHQAAWAAHTSPAQRGEPLSVPQLCLDLGDGLEPVENILDATGWNLTDYSAELSEQDFRLTETGIQWEIDLRQGHLIERHVGETEQADLDLIDTGWPQSQLVQWLERKVRQPDVTQPILLEFVRRAVAYLLDTRHLPLTALVRWRFILAKVLTERINQNREKAAGAGYQKSLFDNPKAAIEASFDYAFNFTANGNAPHWSYIGYPYEFKKHFYLAIGELKNTGEEFECAKALDMCKAIRYWVRNLERRDFWLPLAKGKFYPDFVALLEDGRLLVVEHKGADRVSADDAKAKAAIGALWEAKSGGKALFLMTTVEADKPALAEQIARKTKQ